MKSLIRYGKDLFGGPFIIPEILFGWYNKGAAQ
jgi:hypothetical protein